MPNTNAVFKYYGGKSQPRRYYSERSKSEAGPVQKTPDNDNPLSIEITKAQKASSQNKIYNPYPELSTRKASSDDLVKEGVKTYLASGDADIKDAVKMLEQSKSQLNEAKQGTLESYKPEQIEYAIANIEKQIDAYKARGL